MALLVTCYDLGSMSSLKSTLGPVNKCLGVERREDVLLWYQLPFLAATWVGDFGQSQIFLELAYRYIEWISNEIIIKFKVQPY